MQIPSIGITSKGVQITNQTIPYIKLVDGDVTYYCYENLSTVPGLIRRDTVAGGTTTIEKVQKTLWSARATATYVPIND